MSETPRPALATLNHEPFWDDEWIYEPKLDGQRCLVISSGDTVRVRSRTGGDLSASFPGLVTALSGRIAPDCVADGEIVAFEDGLTSFQRLQPRLRVQDELVFTEGEEMVAALTKLARTENLDAASLTGLGACWPATLICFDTERSEYAPVEVDGQDEVLSLVGDLAPVTDGDQQPPVHAVLGLADGSTREGHVLEAWVCPTLEVVVTESPEHLRRRHDRRTGLALIDTDGA